MKLIMLVIIIGLAVTSFYENGRAKEAIEKAETQAQAAENAGRAVQDVRADTGTVQKQLEATDRQLADAKEAARKLAEEKAIADRHMEERTAEMAKQTAELEEVKKKLAEMEPQLSTAQTELAATKALAAATKDELTKLQEKNKLPPLGSATGKKP